MNDADIKEIKSDVKELLQRSAVHNQILTEHKNFSIALQNEQKVIKTQIESDRKLVQTQLEPLMKDHHLIALVFKVGGAILIGIVVQVVIKRLLLLL